MGYLHIDNLYKAQEILAFKTCYAMEKIHGTSAHIGWNKGKVVFFSGGESHERFVRLFDESALAAKFAERFAPTDKVTVFGEAYGGKQQGMSATYGRELKFVAFDVLVGDMWLAVPQAHEFTLFLGLEFVDYVEIPAELEAINAERDKPSVQAVRNGIVESPKLREGVVLRPPFEVRLNSGKRVIAKHKREEFAERVPPTEIDPIKRELRSKADATAEEWVTPMRLEHVIDGLISGREEKSVNMEDTGKIIILMREDISREAAGEITESEEVRKAISARTAKLFKHRLAQGLEMGGLCP